MSTTEVISDGTPISVTPESVMPDTPVAIETPTPAPVEEKIYTYQPTDDAGRPLGGKQVIKYTTDGELADKLANQATLLLRKLREQTKMNRLGIIQNDEIPDDALRLDVITEFKPRELTQEERSRLSRDLLDPSRFDSATQTLFEATLGASPQKLVDTLNNVQSTNLNLLAKVESDAFVQANPDYFKCKENHESITNWMLRYNLAPVRENFQKAYDTLSAAGVITQAPEPTPVVVPAQVVPVAEPIAPPPAPAPASEPQRIPTGLSRSTASDTPPPAPAPGDDITYQLPGGRVVRGQAAIDAMPSEEYKRRLYSDRTFADKVNKLLR